MFPRCARLGFQRKMLLPRWLVNHTFAVDPGTKRPDKAALLEWSWDERVAWEHAQ